MEPIKPNLNNDSKSKRIHLSPIFVSKNAQFSNVNFRSDSKRLKKSRKSLSLNNINESENLAPKDNNKVKFYDDRFINKPIKDLASARDAVNGYTDEAEKFLNQRLENMDETAQENFNKIRSCISETQIESRILSFADRLPSTHEAGTSNAVTIVRACANKPNWKVNRHIPTTPERVLDAPELVNDYYLNIIHWGSENSLSIGLGGAVYILHCNTGKIHKIGQNTKDDYVSSVQWMGSNACLAVGSSSGNIRIFDISSSKCLRSFDAGNDRVPSLSWNQGILSCGSKRGVITNYDVRVQNAKISCLTAHVAEVCGLSWSANGSYLASGGNDNDVYVWDKNGVVSNGPVVHHFVSHRAAVKAVAWHPRQFNILVTGGGMLDHTLNFWNVSNGYHLSSLPTNSQVSGVVWNPRSDEFVTAHGNPQNQLTLWTYPSMEIGANLMSHTERILGITLSPDGTTVASIGADETVRLWKCFDASQRPRVNDAEHKPQSMFN